MQALQLRAGPPIHDGTAPTQKINKQFNVRSAGLWSLPIGPGAVKENDRPRPSRFSRDLENVHSDRRLESYWLVERPTR